MRETGTCTALFALSFREASVEVSGVILRYPTIVSSRETFPQQNSVRVAHANEELVAVGCCCQVRHLRHESNLRRAGQEEKERLRFDAFPLASASSKFGRGMETLASRNLYYVLLPLTLVMILSGFLRNYLASLFNAVPKPQSAKVVREASVALLCPLRSSY